LVFCLDYYKMLTIHDVSSVFLLDTLFYLSGKIVYGDLLFQERNYGIVK